jgi:hypothetical protein
MAYELWDLTSKNLIDWFAERTEALSAVHAYLDAEEAELVMLVVEEGDSRSSRSYTGHDLIVWAESEPSGSRRSA